jgi:hypothetical protein
VLQRLGRLVEEENFRIGGERARDLHEVPLRERQLGNALAERHAQLVGRDARQEALSFRLASRAGKRRRRELKVFQHGKIGRERRVLIDDRHAVLAHLARIGRVHVLAVVIDGAGIGTQHAGGNANQRRFTGAVLADDGMNLAGHDKDINTFERLHWAKALAQIGERHDRHVRRDRRRGCIYDVMHGGAAA